MKDEERDLMIKIAKELDDIKKRQWFKRLDQEEQSAELKKITAPAEDTAPSTDVRMNGASVPGSSEPVWQITTTFKAVNIDRIRDNQIIQEELKMHITKVCRDHGISKMMIHFEETQPVAQPLG